MRKSLCLLFVAMLTCAAMATAAQGAVVTIGSPLKGTVTQSFGEEETYLGVNPTVGAGARATSPVNGAIIRWHLVNATGAGFQLRVLRPTGAELTFTSVLGSAPVTGAGPGVQTISTALPVSVGDTVGLFVPIEGTEAFFSGGGTSAFWQPALAEGATGKAALGFAEEYGFNAEILPVPTISSLGATSGSTAGGTPVTITGTDLAEIRSVTFGSVPATFTANSEAQITATAPAAGLGSVPITVTTAAGTATSSQQFTYQAPAPTCTVPKLKGKKLKASKKKIRAADCKVGEVAKRKGAKAATGVVVGQNKKPGTVLPAGTIVKVTLGKG